MGSPKKLEDVESLFRLTLALHHLNRDIERKYNLSLVQLSVLMKLRHLPATSAFALAKAVGVHPSTLTQSLRRLIRKESIFVTEDPKDSRKRLIALTKLGKEMVDTVYSGLEEAFSTVSGKADEIKSIQISLGYLKTLSESLR